MTLANPHILTNITPAPHDHTISIIQPDDWHIHLRDGQSLATTVAHASTNFNRVICMPNLVPPVKTTEQAIAYRQRIMQALHDTPISDERKSVFDPCMVLYLTDKTQPSDIITARKSGIVKGVKLYPAGATTNSADGVTDLTQCYPVLEEMQKQGIPLLVHGEVTHPSVDIFDREERFLEEILIPLTSKFPSLRVVLEHITTKQSAEFVLAHDGDNIAATITPQHLLFNRNHLLVGGIKPHFYCLPILKRNIHQQALLKVATSGSSKFFLGTDSAPHATHAKESACGCAGCYTASIALPLYAAAFDQMGAIDKLSDFAGRFGAEFYGLPVNQNRITLKKTPMNVPSHYSYLGENTLTPLMAGESLEWSIID